MFQDGSNIINIGRDDQAGFRLDTMATHKLQAMLCMKGKGHCTTRTDYINKYPSTLQTTSYNFPATGNTGEICTGVVKAPVLFNKNAAQHFADLVMLEKKEIIPAFINPVIDERKEVECARVDGSNISKTSARASSGYPDTEKQMKAQGRRLSTFIVSRCLDTLMKL